MTYHLSLYQIRLYQLWRYQTRHYQTRIRQCVLPLLLLVAIVIATEADANETTTVLVLGDSISAAYGIAIDDGWVALMQNKLEDEYGDINLVNASVTGDTTGNGLGRLPALLEEYNPRMLIIELGGNDGLRGLSIKKLKSNLIDMAEMANNIGAVPVIVAVQLPGNYGKAYNKLFAAAFSSAAEATDAILVTSLFEGMSASSEWFQTDGIHPSTKAQPVMLDNVWKLVEPALEQALAE